MGVLKAYSSRKYLLRMLLSISFLIVAVLLPSAAVLHYSTESRVVQIQDEANRKVMNQIKYNIAYMQEIVKNLALTVWKDDQIFLPLSSNRKREDFEIINAMRLIGQIQSTSSFLHSIVVYNGHLDKIYAQGEMAANLKNSDMAQALANLLRQEKKLPQMQLLPMNVSGKEQSVDFFSMVVYESFHESNHEESSLAVNVQPEWFFNNLKAVNDLAVPDRSDVFIVDRSGHMIHSGNDDFAPSLEGLGEAIESDQAERGEAFGFFSRSFGQAGKFVVSYMDSGIEGWKVVSVQPYKAVIGDIYAMRLTTVSVILFFLIVAVTVTFVIAHKLYKPVEEVLAGIRDRGGAEPEADNGAKDELAFIADAYNEMADRLLVVKREQVQQKSIVHNYRLRALISGSHSFTQATFEETVNLNGLNIATDGPFLLALVKIDDYSEYVARTSMNERLLHYFAFSNIAGETLSPELYACEFADMKSDHAVLVVSARNRRPDPFEGIADYFRRIQEIMHSYYKLSITLTISDPFEGHERIAEQYELILQYSMYKLVFGKRELITSERVAPNLKLSEFSLPAEVERKLVESIKKNELNEMKGAIGAAISQLSGYEYDQILHGVFQLANLIKSTVYEIKKNRVTAVSIDLSGLSRQAIGKETLEEIELLLLDACEEIHEKLQDSMKEKNAVLMEAIKEIVAANYSDYNLSLQSIAELLKMTPAYVGRMFKTSELVSVGEYINETRLNHALDYLETKNFTIKEIMELSGFVNESTFFKHFKKKYGVTPKEYRLKRKIG